MTSAGEEAKRLGNSKIYPEHLFLGLLKLRSGRAIDILMSLGLDFYEVKDKIEQRLEGKRYKSDKVESLDFTLAANSVLKRVSDEAWDLGDDELDSEHVMLAILRNQAGFVTKLFKTMNIDYDIFKEAVLKEKMRMQSEFNDEGDDPEDGDDESSMYNPYRQGGPVSSKSDTPVLDNFGNDITKAAEEGALDPIVGRDREIERLAQILSRRKKNNPVLIGDPGVGKSAIAEGLALRIVQKKVSRVLFDKRVISLDIASIVAGTKYRGQFEERMKAILAELAKNRNIILFIDEIHTIVGAGGSGGNLDAANMLKPALARGEIQCIGATTLDEYRQNIEKDGALERRFQKVIVEPTTAEETLQILKNIKEKYEDHHNVSYTDEALEACVKLSARYITDRNFPDKAIDALDEAGSRVHLTNINVPKEIEEQEKLIEEARSLKAEAVKSQNFELAASYRDREKELSVRLEEMKVEWEARLKDDRQTVGEEEIANVISMMSGVPVQRMAQAEGLKLAGMKEELQAKVIAQDAAIEKLTKAILRSRVGLKDPNHPIGTFMFLGPTGVGKTHLAKQLAKYMFGSADALIRIDMSEYMEKYTVSRMIGAAPGYVGYEEGGQLTEKVRRKPYSIVLLDEIEKAHPDVFNILLQVLDEGRLTDNYGRTIDFKNTVIIMTSNIGTRQLKEFGRGVGFAAQNRTDDNEHSRSVIQKALNKTFAPEFLNRLDEIITFDQLSLEAITKIVDIELKGLYERVEAIGYKLVVEDDAKTFLASKGYDVQFGARPLKRAIQNHLEDGLSELIVAEELQPGDTVNVSVDKEKDELSIRKA